MKRKRTRKRVVVSNPELEKEKRIEAVEKALRAEERRFRREEMEQDQRRSRRRARQSSETQ